MYELLSNRIKNEKGEPEVFVYDDFNQSFRNQVFYILEDITEPYCDFDGNLWDKFEELFCREKGLKCMDDYSRQDYGRGKWNIETYFEKASNVDFLDAVDFFFNIFDMKLRNVNPESQYEYDSGKAVDNAITELNYRFKQHNLGYEFINSQIIRIDHTIMHKNIVKPMLKLLYEEGFEGAEEEIREAYEKRRNNDNKNAILYAGKSFESTMKTICDKMSYPYDKNKDTAQKLINILESNGFYPIYLSSYLTNIRTTLETGLPVVRNKLAGHGQGVQVVNIPDEMADYALHLAATNILFLVRLYKSKVQNP